MEFKKKELDLLHKANVQDIKHKFIMKMIKKLDM